jgi:cytochrome c553
MIKTRRPGNRLLPFLLGMAMLAALPARADPENVVAPPIAGRCVGCHGADGIGKAPQYPDLRGQKAAYMEKQMRAFRSGERQDPWMSAMARSLTDEEIATLSAWFAALR